mmetsp:Transcript_40767/g.67711  ORF Transcript_40767/g.67711 Transcript_40767/m.67711 type:complete len:987 (-) Transcript_40767:172-3132(-)
MAMRGLTVFISDLRNCSSKEQESKRVEKEMAHIRSKFTSDTHMNGYNRKKYVWKILYMYMLGYEVDFGHMEAVNLISSPKYSEKSVGYAWCALMLREGDELLRLIINSIRVDLISKNDNAVCLALNAICNVGGKEFAEALSQDVLKLLTSNLTKTYVRKKAALTTLRMYRKAPDILSAAEWADKILMLLDEKNIGVLTSISSLVLGVLAIDSSGWEGAAPKAARTLTRLVLNKDYSNDYLYYGIPTPWLQIKLLRMLQFFPPPEEHALKLRVSEVLQRIVSGTDVTKNVNKNNATHAVLFEAINLTIHLGQQHADTLQQSINLLGRFISIREANIRYLGLETMARLSQLQPETLEGLKKHQSTILFSLKDPDISIRRRALDLVYAMCDTASVKETVSELLTYLASADLSIREELVLKIAILAERFAADHQWYVDVVLQLIKSAGDNVSEEIWYRVVQIITNQGDDLQKYATEMVWRALQSESMPHSTLVKVAGYVLGEFGHTIADAPGCSAAQQLELLHKQFGSAEPDVRALLLNTYVKLAHTFTEISGQVQELMQQLSTALDQEVQQRASEYLSLSNPSLDGIKSTVLEMMPHFTERESVVQKTLSKSQGDEGIGGRRATSEARPAAADESETAEPKIPVATPAAPPELAPDLLGSLDDGPSAAVPSGTAADAGNLIGALSLDAAPPAAPTSAVNDLLGLMGDSPAPAPPPAPPAAMSGNLLHDLAGPTPAATPSASATATSGQSAQWQALCLRNDGVLFEDATIQIGVKMEFQGHQGRLALFFGNKTAAPISSLATQLSPCPGVTIQASPLADTLQPRSQQQQLFNIECVAPFGDGPQLAVRFMGGPTPPVLRLPLVASKFMQPLRVDGNEFFRRWKVFDGKELQQIFKLSSVPLPEAAVDKVVCTGMHMALLKGVDPNAANYVLAGWLATKGCGAQADDASVLMRLEVNSAAGMCRASMRASSGELVSLLTKLVIAQLGTPSA